MEVNRRQQYGISGMALIFIIAIIGFSAWIALKIVPIYADNAKMANALENIKSQPGVAQKSNSEIKSMLLRRLTVESISRINHKNFKEYVKFKKTGNGFEMTVKYNDEAPVMGNLYLLVKFDKTIEVP